MTRMSRAAAVVSLFSVASGLALARSADYGSLPLHFEVNRGQTAAEVRFSARGDGYAMFLTPAEVVLVLADRSPRCSSVLRVKLVGADPAPQVVGSEGLPGEVNYLLGRDPARWRAGIPTFGEVTYRQVYPGIDWVHSGNQRQLEFDFRVAPRADATAIRLAFDGAEQLALDAEGDLVLRLDRGELRLRKPHAYQDAEGGRKEVGVEYRVEPDQQVTFRLGEYETSRALLIDPLLSYSTYLGGLTVDEGRAIAVDAVGSAYLTGVTVATGLPTTSGSFDTSIYSDEVFVTKIDPRGGSLVYSTYVGGARDKLGVFEYGLGIAVDSAGAAYVTGSTSDAEFPATAGAYHTTFDANQTTVGFVTKLDPTGRSLVYSTLLKGTIQGSAIAIDTSGAAYVTGDLVQGLIVPVFPVKTGAFDAGYNGDYDAYALKLNPAGSDLVYSTFLGGAGADHGRSIAIDPSGNAYVTGDTESSNFPATAGAFDRHLDGARDAFVVMLNPAGSQLVYGTFLGGAQADLGSAIAVGSSAAYVTGWTASSDFPATPGAFDTTYNGGLADAFVAKLNAAGSALVYATYLGGRNAALDLFDSAAGIAVDGSGAVSLGGRTDSLDFPVTPDALDSSFNGGVGVGDAFLARLSADGARLLYSTYLGGTKDDEGLALAVDPLGAVYLAGVTTSGNFPTTSGSFDRSFNGTGDPGNGDAFVVKLQFPVSTPPGEAAKSVGDGEQMLASYDKASRRVGITYTPACDASNHAVYWGPLAGVASYEWGGEECSVGTSGTAAFDPGPGDVFFVIVGNNGSVEGSYGRDSAGRERSEDTSAAGCQLPQDLTGNCSGP
jgi:Beta-propeller repeat